jgi:hypothetical protein
MTETLRRSGTKVAIKAAALDALLGSSNPVEASLGVTPPASVEPSPAALVEVVDAPAPPPPAEAPVRDLARPSTPPPPEPFSVTIRKEVKELAFSVHDALYGAPHHYTMAQFIEEAIVTHARHLADRFNGGAPFPPPANPRRPGRRRGKRT